MREVWYLPGLSHFSCLSLFVVKSTIAIYYFLKVVLHEAAQGFCLIGLYIPPDSYNSRR